MLRALNLPSVRALVIAYFTLVCFQCQHRPSARVRLMRFSMKRLVRLVTVEWRNLAVRRREVAAVRFNIQVRLGLLVSPFLCRLPYLPTPHSPPVR